MSKKLRTTYSDIEPYMTGMLQVSPLHRMYFEECGNPTGLPVVVLHGGPGGGFSPGWRTYFNPKKYRIILFDQRGAGKSTPAGELRENTTAHLVEDIETLRHHLGVKRWIVFGGSWGSTLALCYAIKYPKCVRGMIIRGIYFGTKDEIVWGYEANMLERFYPDHWDEYVSLVPPRKRKHMVRAYHQLLSSGPRSSRIRAGRAMAMWELVASDLKYDPKELDEELGAEEETLQWASIANHYFLHHCFLKEGYILDNAHKLRNIPTVIVQGRYDMVCPVRAAHQLKEKLPRAELHINIAGHAGADPENTHCLVEATDKFAKLFS